MLTDCFLYLCGVACLGWLLFAGKVCCSFVYLVVGGNWFTRLLGVCWGLVRWGHFLVAATDLFVSVWLVVLLLADLLG